MLIPVKPAAQPGAICPASERATPWPISMRMDVFAWATWLRWGRGGDEKSILRLREELERSGIWMLASQNLEINKDPITKQEAGPDGLAKWPAYELMLVAAAVALVGRHAGACSPQLSWSRKVAQHALGLAEARSPSDKTADGVPVLLACRLAFAVMWSAQIEETADCKRALATLALVLNDPQFAALPLRWRISVWRTAAEQAGAQGDALAASHYLGLLSAHDRSASGLLARMRLISAPHPETATAASSSTP